MSNVNKVKLLSERTSGVPPVIFSSKTPADCLGRNQSNDPLTKYFQKDDIYHEKFYYKLQAEKCYLDNWLTQTAASDTSPYPSCNKFWNKNFITSTKNVVVVYLVNDW